MDKVARNLLTTDEQQLVRRTSAARLERLDEDELVELHDRVRRARNKYAKLHRRQAASQVGKDASRAVAAGKNQRTARKSEIFEQALAAVSHQLAKLATERAAELRAERLAAAAAARSGDRNAKSPAKRKKPTDARAKAKGRRSVSHVTDRRAASTRAAGKRSQAKRDSKR